MKRFALVGISQACLALDDGAIEHVVLTRSEQKLNADKYLSESAVMCVAAPCASQYHLFPRTGKRETATSSCKIGASKQVTHRHLQVLRGLPQLRLGLADDRRDPGESPTRGPRPLFSFSSVFFFFFFGADAAVESGRQVVQPRRQGARGRLQRGESSGEGPLSLCKQKTTRWARSLRFSPREIFTSGHLQSCLS